MVIIILSGYTKADLAKENTRSCKALRNLWRVGASKTWQGFSKKILPETNKKVTAVLLIAWVINQKLNF